MLLALAMTAALAGCSNGGGNGGTSSQPPAGDTQSQAPQSNRPELTIPQDAYVAMVTDVGNIDDGSFNEGSYNGIKAFCDAYGVKYHYFRPSEDSTEARLDSITSAVEESNATVVVASGYMAAGAIYEAQTMYPDVMFLAIDVAKADMLGAGGVNTNAADFNADDYDIADYVKPNTALITYQEEQAGYLAGYAAVKDGYTKLGFLGGMAVPAVIRYGYGFVQGADAAAKEMNTTVDMKYWYSGSFSPTDDIKVKMDSWYTDGTEVVFSCGGGIYLSAVAAADAAGGKVIGVDVDQGPLSELIITSAMKELANSVDQALTALYQNGGTWPADYASNQVVLGAAQGDVGLPTDSKSWRFENFTIEEYQALFDKFLSGEVTVSNDITSQPQVSNVNVDYQG